MHSLAAYRSKFVADATRARHMAAVSAVVLASIFLPILGSPLKAYEVQELRELLGLLTQQAPADAPPQVAQPAERRARGEGVRVETVALEPVEIVSLSGAPVDEVEAAPADRLDGPLPALEDEALALAPLEPVAAAEDVKPIEEEDDLFEDGA